MVWPNSKIILEISSNLSKSGFRSRSVKKMETADSEFDSAFRTATNQSETVQRLLSRGVRWQIEKLRRLAKDDQLIVTIYRGNLTISTPGFIKDYVKLDDFLRLSLELFDQMMLVDAEGIEFVNDDMATVVDDVKCPICSGEITFDLVICTRCKTPHCKDCWEYNGQCATFACGETRYVSIGSASS
ncbi:MAG: RING finger protein [Planctomycetota bacterium]